MKRKLFILTLVVLGLFVLAVYYLAPFHKPEIPIQKASSEKITGVWILADTSASMRGYFRTMHYQGSTIQRFLWNGLIPTLLESFPSDKIYFSPFGSEIRTPKPVNSLLASFRFENSSQLQDFFSETETKLTEVFGQVKNSSYSAFVVITDGIPSSRGEAGPAPQMVQAIRSLMKRKGQYLWLIGIRSEFRGKVYPQCPNEYGQMTSFLHVGQRPIFIWVGARNKQKGMRITASCLNKLRSLSQTPGDIRFVEFCRPELPDADLIIPKTQAALVLRSRDPMEIRIAGNRTCKHVDIPLEVRWHREELEMQRHSIVEISPEYFPGANVREYQDNQWHLIVDPVHVSRRPFKIRLKVRLTMPKWWVDWSTEDDSSETNASRTLYLGQLVEPFVKSYFKSSYTITEIRVTIRVV